MDTGELYALPPERFTAARDAAARQAKADGDAAAAEALKALRRPSVAAWLVNRLASEQAELLDQLLELGPALAAAQSGGQADELRALGSQRRRRVEAVADAAVSSAGRSVGGPVRDEVVGTLEAALADPRTAQAVRSGRLVRALSYAGFGEVDLSDAVAEPSGELSGPGRGAHGAAAQANGKGRGKGTGRGGKAGADPAEAAQQASRQQAQQAEQQTRKRIAAAEQQAHDAAGALDDAVRTAERAQQASDASADEEVQAQAAVRRAAEALAVAERVRDDAGSARERAEAAAERARGTVRTAQEVADAARRELDRLRRA